MINKTGISEKITEVKIRKGWGDMLSGRTRPAHMIFDKIRERHTYNKISSCHGYTEEELIVAIEEGRKAVRQGKVISAKEAYADFRKEHRIPS